MTSNGVESARVKIYGDEGTLWLERDREKSLPCSKATSVIPNPRISPIERLAFPLFSQQFLSFPCGLAVKPPPLPPPLPPPGENPGARSSSRAHRRPGYISSIISARHFSRWKFTRARLYNWGSRRPRANNPGKIQWRQLWNTYILYSAKKRSLSCAL